MAYQTYITEAIVCGSRDRNTSDRSYLLFSREAGMVWASARSVRLERSKQRFALQDFSHVRATLVKGKAGWRIAGVESLGNLYFVCTSREARTCLRNTVRLLRRVMQGETPHPEIFDDVIKGLVAETEQHEIRESFIALRILNILGYVAPHAAYNAILSDVFEYASLEDSIDPAVPQKAIAHALERSQL